MTNKTFLISNMKSQSCSDKIYGALSSIRGIENININLESKAVFVTFDSETIPEELLRDVIEDQGFTVVK